MIKKIKIPGVFMGILLGFLSLAMANTLPEPSGELVNGFRVLKVGESKDPLLWVVFQGDYIKFDIGKARENIVLSIPALGAEEKLISDLDKAPYIKMKAAGTFDFSIGSLAGTLRVVEYAPANYEAVSAPKAKALIDSLTPLVLDVRTPREYASGHLENSTLIPVQELQARLGELAPFKDQPILIYCATGNRSTVASKILIDKGFTRIFNLKKGIVEWGKSQYPIVK